MSEKENNVTNSFLADRLAGKVDHLGNPIEKKEAKPMFIKTEEVKAPKIAEVKPVEAETETTVAETETTVAETETIPVSETPVAEAPKKEAKAKKNKNKKK